MIHGEDDMDVHAAGHPTAFVLTALSLVMLVVICGAIALSPNVVDAQRIWGAKSPRSSN